LTVPRGTFVVPDGAVAAKVEVRDGAVIVRFYDAAGEDIGGYDVPLSVDSEGTNYRAIAQRDTVTL
jgi:hypothetical protein